MTLSEGVAALADRVAQEIKAVRGDVTELQARTQVLVLAPGDPIPPGTPAGTVILRQE